MSAAVGPSGGWAFVPVVSLGATVIEDQLLMTGGCSSVACGFRNKVDIDPREGFSGVGISNLSPLST